MPDERRIECRWEDGTVREHLLPPSVGCPLTAGGLFS